MDRQVSSVISSLRVLRWRIQRPIGLLVLTLLLTMQLVLSCLHHHEAMSAQDDHCVACEIAALISGGVPPILFIACLPILLTASAHDLPLRTPTRRLPRYRLAWSAAP